MEERRRRGEGREVGVGVGEGGREKDSALKKFLVQIIINGETTDKVETNVMVTIV
jgi:hypothetical protein